MSQIQNAPVAKGISLWRWMQVRGSGSWAQFSDAVHYLYDDTHHPFAIALRFCALGHVEFDWSGKDLHWRVVPVSFFAAPLANDAVGFGLCGALSAAELATLTNRNVRIIEERDHFVGNETLPRIWIYNTPHTRRVVGDMGLPIAPLAFQDLRLRLPSVDALLTGGIEVPVFSEARRFNPGAHRFGDNVTLRGRVVKGCYQVEGYPRPTYVWVSTLDDDVAICYPCERQIGLWGAYALDGPRRMTLRGGKLRIPRFPSLPVLYERMLYLAGARCLGPVQNYMEFDRVRGHVVGALLQKLPLELVQQ